MASRVGTYLPRNINRYVPGCTFAADVNIEAPVNIDFGTPVTTNTNTILSAQSIATAGSAIGASMLLTVLDGTWGRALRMVSSGAATGTVIITGRDYLGQPMKESVTLTTTTAVNGLKAFKYVDQISWASASGLTMSVGVANVWGLPYKAIKVLSEEADEAPAGTLGTLTAPVITDPATVTTGDPRGTFVPNTTPDGSKRITATLLFSNKVNSSGNGGLYGIAHYFA